MKSWQIVVLVIVILVGGLFFLISKTSNPQTPSTTPGAMIYFWSETCPHCKNVADFLNTWPNTNKLNLDKREISRNQGNNLLFTQKAAECGIPRGEMGVPLLVTLENKCIIGDSPVIDYFKSLYPEGETSPSAQPI